jgi:chromosome segregation ATPase
LLSSARLQENVRELSSKNAEIVKSNAAAKQKLSGKTLESEQLNKDVAELKQTLKQLNMAAQQRDLEAGQTIKGLNLQCEDVTFKLQSLTAQHEALLQQMKVSVLELFSCLEFASAGCRCCIH